MALFIILFKIFNVLKTTIKVNHTLTPQRVWKQEACSLRLHTKYYLHNISLLPYEKKTFTRFFLKVRSLKLSVLQLQLVIVTTIQNSIRSIESALIYFVRARRAVNRYFYCRQCRQSYKDGQTIRHNRYEVRGII